MLQIFLLKKLYLYLKQFLIQKEDIDQQVSLMLQVIFHIICIFKKGKFIVGVHAEYHKMVHGVMDYAMLQQQETVQFNSTWTKADISKCAIANNQQMLHFATEHIDKLFVNIISHILDFIKFGALYFTLEDSEQCIGTSTLELHWWYKR